MANEAYRYLPTTSGANAEKASSLKRFSAISGQRVVFG
jgi:hypothetical protein